MLFAQPVFNRFALDRDGISVYRIQTPQFVAILISVEGRLRGHATCKDFVFLFAKFVLVPPLNTFRNECSDIWRHHEVICCSVGILKSGGAPKSLSSVTDLWSGIPKSQRPCIPVHKKCLRLSPHFSRHHRLKPSDGVLCLEEKRDNTENFSNVRSGAACCLRKTLSAENRHVLCMAHLIPFDSESLSTVRWTQIPGGNEE